jgi:choline-glycine betaine transporter
LRKEVVTGTPPPARPKAAKTKKQGNKNATFIWGCSVLAVIMIISLLGLAWLFFQNRRNAPPSPTSTAAPSATPTEVYTLVAPWLEDATPTPEGE